MEGDALVFTILFLNVLNTLGTPCLNSDGSTRTGNQVSSKGYKI